MKKMMVSDITKTIYYGEVEKVENGLYKSVGKREDVTDEAVRAVFEWFIKNLKENESIGAYEVRFEDCPYVLRMFEEKRKGGEK